MKIKYIEPYYNYAEIYEVVGVYWGLKSVGFGQDEPYSMFYGITPTYDAIRPLNSEEVEILDATFKGEWVFVGDDFGAIFYAPLTRDNLLDDVLEREPGAFDKLWDYVRRDGLWEDAN